MWMQLSAVKNYKLNCAWDEFFTVYTRQKIKPFTQWSRFVFFFFFHGTKYITNIKRIQEANKITRHKFYVFITLQLTSYHTEAYTVKKVTTVLQRHLAGRVLYRCQHLSPYTPLPLYSLATCLSHRSHHYVKRNASQAATVSVFT